MTNCASMCRYNLIIETPFHSRVSKLKLRKLLYLRSLLQDLAIDANADEIWGVFKTLITQVVSASRSAILILQVYLKSLLQKGSSLASVYHGPKISKNNGQLVLAPQNQLPGHFYKQSIQTLSHSLKTQDLANGLVRVCLGPTLRSSPKHWAASLS